MHLRLVKYNNIDEKSAIANGAGCFNKMASKAYSDLSQREKERLVKLCNDHEKDQTLSR